jgi:hypothetical protein
LQFALSLSGRDDDISVPLNGATVVISGQADRARRKRYPGARRFTPSIADGMPFEQKLCRLFVVRRLDQIAHSLQWRWIRNKLFHVIALGNAAWGNQDRLRSAYRLPVWYSSP